MREYGYLEKMLDMLTDPYTHRDLQNVRKNRKLETNIGKLFSLLADGFEVIHKNAELVRLWDDLENAEGAVLDRYGANFGVQRGAASDALYRILIRVKMLAQLSGGDVARALVELAEGAYQPAGQHVPDPRREQGPEDEKAPEQHRARQPAPEGEQEGGGDEQRLDLAVFAARHGDQGMRAGGVVGPVGFGDEDG